MSENKNNKPKSKNNSSSAKKAKISSTTKNVSSSNKLINEYNEIINVLSVIFLNNKTINLLKNNSDFKKIIVKLLSIGKQIEKEQKIKQENNISTSIAAYENITNENFKPIDYKLSNNIKKDKLEILDEINYVKVFLLNSINLKWDDLVKTESANKQQLVENNTNYVETVDAKKIDDENQQNNQQYINAQHYKDAEDFLNKNNISLNDIADGIAKQQAQVLLQRDIMNNKFYQYDSKPKFFVISKYFMFGLWAAFFIVYLVYSIFQILLIQHPYQLIHFNEPYSVKQMQNDTIIYGNGNIIAVVLLAVITILGLFMVFRMAKNWKNDNVKYSFKSFLSWVIIFCSVMTIIIPLIASSNASILGMFDRISSAKDLPSQLVSFTENNINYEFNFNNKESFSFYNAYYILTILLIVIIGLILLWTVALMIIRPKPDVNRINEKINEYYNDIINGRIKVDNSDSAFSNGFFGGKNPFSPF